MHDVRIYPDTRVARLDNCGCGCPYADHNVRHGRDRRGCANCALCRDYTGDNAVDAAAKALRRLGASDPELTERAVAELVREITIWKDAWAQGQVDIDRQVRAASARALDCADHGRIIFELEKQLYAVDTTHQTTDQQRAVLVMGFSQLRESFEALRKRLADGDDPPPIGRLVDAVIAVLSEALTDHSGVAKTPRKRRPKQQALSEVTS